MAYLKEVFLDLSFYKMILTIYKVGQPNGSSILIYINAKLCLSLTACNHDTTDHYLKKQRSKTSSTSIHRCTEEIDMGVVFDKKLPLGTIFL